MSVNILIKSPTQQVDDFEFTCDSNWTVSKLKDHLYAEYPTKPVQSQQKVIYCGRVLPDHLQLKDIIIKGVNVHTMHLVCPFIETVSRTPSPVVDQVKQESTEFASPVDVAPTFGDDGPRQRIWSAYPNQFNVPYPPGQLPSVGTVPVASPYMAYQMAMAQQAYAQMMTQFLSQNQLGQAQPQQSYNNVPDSTNGAANVPPDQERPEVNPQPDNRQQPLDVLDYFHLLTRLMVLLVIIYFYSSLSKVLLVICLGLLFNVLRRHQQRAAPQPVPEIPETQNAVPNDSEPGNDEQETSSGSETPRAESQGLFERIVTKGVIPFITFVKVFFTSLIPEQQPIEA